MKRTRSKASKGQIHIHDCPFCNAEFLSATEALEHVRSFHARAKHQENWPGPLAAITLPAESAANAVSAPHLPSSASFDSIDSVICDVLATNANSLTKIRDMKAQKMAATSTATANKPKLSLLKESAIGSAEDHRPGPLAASTLPAKSVANAVLASSSNPFQSLSASHDSIDSVICDVLTTQNNSSAKVRDIMARKWLPEAGAHPAKPKLVFLKESPVRCGKGSQSDLQKPTMTKCANIKPIVRTTEKRLHTTPKVEDSFVKADVSNTACSDIQFLGEVTASGKPCHSWREDSSVPLLPPVVDVSICSISSVSTASPLEEEFKPNAGETSSNDTHRPPITSAQAQNTPKSFLWNSEPVFLRSDDIPVGLIIDVCTASPVESKRVSLSIDSLWFCPSQDGQRPCRKQATGNLGLEERKTPQEHSYPASLPVQPSSKPGTGKSVNQAPWLFACDLCGLSLASRDLKVKHLARFHRCPQCAEVFRAVYDRSVHIHQVHLAAKEKRTDRNGNTVRK